MFENIDIKITYMADGEEKTVSGDTETFSLVVNNNSGKLLINILPLINEIDIINASVTIKYDFGKDDRIFVNGYQSRSLSKEYEITDKEEFKNSLKDVTGDTDYIYPNKSGVFRSYTYTYIRNGREFNLIGSINESSGFTIFDIDAHENTITISRDVKGSVITNMLTLFDLVSITGDEDKVFSGYFDKMGLKSPKMESLTIYSIYNDGASYTEDYAVNEIQNLKAMKIPANLVLLDEGYQGVLGDWLADNLKFPKGLKQVCDKIHDCGMMAGIWISPFICSVESEIIKQHPQWVIKDENNQPLFGEGKWGKYFILDYYNPKVQVYINNAFDKIFSDWDFDVVKIDKLYTQCMYPRWDQNRGQIMYDAMMFLREISEDKLIIADEVPLGSAFGNVDVCRVCCDFGEQWDIDDKLEYPEEDNSTSALESMIFRRQLDKRAFNSCVGRFPISPEYKFKPHQKVSMVQISNLTTSAKNYPNELSLICKKEGDLYKELIDDCVKHIDFAEFGKRGNELDIEYTYDSKKIDGSLDLKNGKF